MGETWVYIFPFLPLNFLLLHCVSCISPRLWELSRIFCREVIRYASEIVREWNCHLEIFSSPQVMEKSRQCLLRNNNSSSSVLITSSRASDYSETSSSLFFVFIVETREFVFMFSCWLLTATNFLFLWGVQPFGIFPFSWDDVTNKRTTFHWMQSLKITRCLQTRA